MSTPSGSDEPRPPQWPLPTALHWSDIADAIWLASREGFQVGPAPPATEPGVEDGPVASGECAPGRESARDPAEPVPAAGPSTGPGESALTVAGEAVAERPAPVAHLPPIQVVQRRADFFASLRHDSPSSSEAVIDEEATAERGMIDRRWLPVLRQAVERRWNVVVVVDAGPSMWIWAGYVAGISALLERQGVFRDIRVRTLASDGIGGIEIGSGGGRVTTTPAGMVDPTGRTVVLVLTDGYADVWWTGAAQSAVALWATHMVVAVLNPLPQQRWSQTALQPRRTWMRTAGPAPTARMTWTRSAVDAADPAAAGLVNPVAVPVLEIDGRWVRRWADLVSGRGSGAVPLPAILVSTSHPRQATSAEVGHGEQSAVARFRATASPVAVRLAVLLAAAPLNVRTMLAIQRKLPRAGPAELAEVLTSGLIRPVVPDGEVTDPDPVRITFDFADGARKRLLDLGYRDRTIDVLHTVEAELGDEVEAVRGLSHRIAAPALAEPPRVTASNRPFLRVELAVNEALSGPHLIAATRLHRLLDDYAATRPLHRTVGGMVTPSDGSDVPIARLDELLGPDVHRMGEPGIGHGAESLAADANRHTATIQNLPPRNANFTGRTELLAVLHARLRSGTTAVLPEAIHGFGGVGKSQLAIEYVHRYQHDYDIVWWIPAERPAQIRTALFELAQRLGLPVTPSAGSGVLAVIDALSRGNPSSSWLLVFDNAEHPDDVQPFFPAAGTGKVMVTSRNPEWNEVANPIQVDVFSRSESVQLLMRRGQELTESDADRLAQAMGDLPLAVELAAAWCAETGMATNEYLRLLDAGRPALTAEVVGDPTIPQPVPDYPEAVAAAWSMSLIALREREPAALRLLQVCAFFAPEPISRILLSNARGLGIHPDLDPVLRNANRFNQAVRTIGRYSLARVDYRTNSLHMHRLVQRVLVAQMNADQRESLRHSAHLLLAANDPNLPDETDHWPRYAELYPHVLASNALECRQSYVRDLVLNEAKYLSRWGDYRGARDLSMSAYDALVRDEGPEHPDSLRMAYWLGYMYFTVGDYRAASELNTTTLQLYRQVLGENREETLDAIGAVAADLRVDGDFTGALERSLTVYERSRESFGELEPFTLRAAHNLAVSLRLSGLFGRALQLAERTYAQLVQVLGADHLETLNTRGGINLDRRELGDHVQARTDQESLVTRLRNVLPDERHALLLTQTQQLAVARRKAGDLSNALKLSEGVLGRYQERYGEGYPDTTLARLTMSIDQRVLGDLRAARESGELAVAQLRQIYGADHPHTASAEVNLAVTMRLQGETDAVLELDERSVRRLTARLGAEHPVVLHARINLVSDYHAVNQARVAYEQGTVVLRQCRELLGVNHPTTLACAVNVAMDLRQIHRTDDGDRLLAQTLTRFRAMLGPEHPAAVSAQAGQRANCDIDPLPL